MGDIGLDDIVQRHGSQFPLDFQQQSNPPTGPPQVYHAHVLALLDRVAFCEPGKVQVELILVIPLGIVNVLELERIDRSRGFIRFID